MRRAITITGYSERWPPGAVLPVIGSEDVFDIAAVDEVKATALVEEYKLAVWGKPEIEAPRSTKPKRLNVGRLAIKEEEGRSDE